MELRSQPSLLGSPAGHFAKGSGSGPQESPGSYFMGHRGTEPRPGAALHLPGPPRGWKTASQREPAPPFPFPSPPIPRLPSRFPQPQPPACATDRTDAGSRWESFLVGFTLYFLK